MIKLAFCDDDVSVLNSLQVFLDKYRVQRSLEFQSFTFHSPLDLLAEIERGAQFDILFLDVLMPGETGIEAAAEIRNYDQNVKIIFLTSSAEYAVQSYTVGAYFYQLKPILEESFFRLMDSVVSACEKEKSDSLILRCKNGISRIELRNLEYCEVFHRTLLIHLANGKVLESTGSMDELNRQLESCGVFIRPQDHVVHIFRTDFRTVQHFLHDDGGQLLLIILAERAIHLTHRSAYAIGDNNISHGSISSSIDQIRLYGK